MSELQILVVGFHELFCEALRSVLRQAGMEPVCMVYDPRSAVQDISMVAPNVIIVEQADGQPDLALTAWNLVSQNAHAKLISLNLNDNQVGIYDRRRREILTGQDLIEVVTGP